MLKPRPAVELDDTLERGAPDPIALREIARRSNTTKRYGQRFWAIDRVNLYPKQTELLELGASKRERMFRCANQSGKSFAACVEISYHLTGRYPAWFKGHRFSKPIALGCARKPPFCCAT